MIPAVTSVPRLPLGTRMTVMRGVTRRGHNWTIYKTLRIRSMGTMTWRSTPSTSTTTNRLLGRAAVGEIEDPALQNVVRVQLHQYFTRVRDIDIANFEIHQTVSDVGNALLWRRRCHHACSSLHSPVASAVPFGVRDPQRATESADKTIRGAGPISGRRTTAVTPRR